MTHFQQDAVMKIVITCLAVLFVFQTSISAREWTNAADGKKIEAEFISSDGTNVTIKRGTQQFTLPLARLVQADRDFVKEQMAKANEPKGLEGAYTDKFTGEWALADYKGLPYAIYGAKDLDGEKKYPVVVSLHGRSDDNTNGGQIGFAKKFSQAANYEKNPCIIIAPLCYQPFGATGGGWDDEPGDKALDLLKDILKICPIVDEDRVYVVGYSMGGYGATHFVATEPKIFAAAIPVAGCKTSAASACKKLPIWIFHASDDPTVNVSCSRDLYLAIKRNEEAKFTEYPNGGHGIVGKVFDDENVQTWLFAQKQGN